MGCSATTALSTAPATLRRPCQIILDIFSCVLSVEPFGFHDDVWICIRVDVRGDGNGGCEYGGCGEADAGAVGVCDFDCDHWKLAHAVAGAKY